MSATLAETLREEATRLGFDSCRFTSAAPAPHREAFLQWLAERQHGDMAWLARDPERRAAPSRVLEGARSVVVLTMNYFQGDIGSASNGGRIARYAWGEDYHDLMLDRLRILSGTLGAAGGTQKCYVDTGPLLERDLAARAGLGWQGKSTMLIDKKRGAWFFLGAILTTLELPPDAEERDHCGSCERCVIACPTAAILPGRVVDARRCISYLTIENKGPIPLEFRRAIGDRIYGCDECIEVCPWNRFASRSREIAFEMPERLRQMKARDFLGLDESGFRELFRRSPVKRIKRHRFLRNVCVALGNTGTVDDLPALTLAASDPEPLIAEHAAWACTEIRARLQSESTASRMKSSKSP